MTNANTVTSSDYLDIPLCGENESVDITKLTRIKIPIEWKLNIK